MLQYILDRFPHEIALPDGAQCTVRPLEAKDEAELERFHLSIPEEDRMFIKDRISDESVFHEWCQNIDLDQNFLLLAFDGDKIVADMTLHQRLAGWRRHIGLVSSLTHPDYRGLNLVHILLSEVVDIARHCGLSRLEARFNAERDTAIAAFLQAGFIQLARIPEYVIDQHDSLHDYVLIGKSLAHAEEAPCLATAAAVEESAV